MKHWLEHTSEKIKEYYISAYMFSCLLYCATIFMLLSLPLNVDFTNIAVILPICYIFVFLLIRKNNDDTFTFKKPNIHTFLLTSINITIITIVVFWANNNRLNLSSLFFIPVILAALNENKTYRYLVTFICSAGIIVIRYASFRILSEGNLNLDSDVILISILFLAGWLIGGLRDVDSETMRHLQTLANYDSLTGLINHRYFQEKLDTEIQDASINKKCLSLIMADLDYFKFYNDTYGHQYGDEVLKQIGQILKEETAKIGFAARYGGEEFVIVLPGFTKQEAVQVAEVIRQRISSYKFHGAETQPKGRLTISCGLATYPESAVTKKDLIRAADQALYQAKSISKNKTSLYFNIFDQIQVSAAEKDIINSIKTLISIINAKDRYTYGHSERVCLYAKKIAQRIGLDQKSIKKLSIAAFLHDIGKIEIQREILNKTSPLTLEERDTIYQHPLWGAEIIRPIQALQDISPIILHHHENFDGSGYPCQIKGTDIPLEARIIRIVDSFDAITTNRPYRTSQTVEKALDELEEFAGSYYDPTLVKHFIELHKEGKLEQNPA